MLKMSTIALVFGLTTLATASHACAHSSKHTLSKAAQARPPGYTAITAKKSGSDVQMSYKIQGTPAVGKPFAVSVNITSAGDTETTLTADDGVGLQEPAQVLRSQAGQTTQHVLNLTPQEQGRFYINLFSTVQGRTSASAFAIQVGSSPAALKSANPVQEMPSGERIKVMPVP
jgi:hypothetical protein